MRVIRHDAENAWDVYSIKCDICGEPLMLQHGKQMVLGEFLSCGEEEMNAELRGWIVAGRTAICVDCLKSLGKEKSNETL